VKTCSFKPANSSSAPSERPVRRFAVASVERGKKSQPNRQNRDPLAERDVENEKRNRKNKSGSLCAREIVEATSPQEIASVHVCQTPDADHETTSRAIGFDSSRSCVRLVRSVALNVPAGKFKRKIAQVPGKKPASDHKPSRYDYGFVLHTKSAVISSLEFKFCVVNRVRHLRPRRFDPTNTQLSRLFCGDGFLISPVE